MHINRIIHCVSSAWGKSDDPLDMAVPRKFSDKIALLTQKEIEGTAAFNAVLREVSATTQVISMVLLCKMLRLSFR